MPKNSLVANINRRKKAGTSRSKSSSTISKESYGDMENGWPESKKKAKTTSTKKPARKTSTKKPTKKASTKSTKSAKKARAKRAR